MENASPARNPKKFESVPRLKKKTSKGDTIGTNLEALITTIPNLSVVDFIIVPNIPEASTKDYQNTLSVFLSVVAS